jgi:AAA domain/UvrD-like helicase C-terminal domain
MIHGRIDVPSGDSLEELVAEVGNSNHIRATVSITYERAPSIMNSPNPSVLLGIERAKARLAEIAAAKKAAIAQSEKNIEELRSANAIVIPDLAKLGWRIDSTHAWNAEQGQMIHAFLAGKSFCYIGAAGTGKTTGLKGAVASAIDNNLVTYIQPHEATKWLAPGKPGIVLTAFTNMAVRQIAKHFSKEVTCITIHKLLEFAPVYYEVEAPDGTIKKTMRFEPSRNRFNPLPRSLTRIVIDEASMADIELRNLIIDALPNPSAMQWIIVGDLNQLPPIYGKAVLAESLLKLPIIELTQVYRQALQSPIITLAHKMKNGEAIPVNIQLHPNDPKKQIPHVIDAGPHGKVTIHPWKQPLAWEDACNLAANHMKASILNGLFDPFKDIILIPKNVNFGQLELNRNIADWLGRQRGAVVHEIIAGFITHYYAVGDKVLVNKREAIITKIQRNRNYYGKRPISADLYEIDRWGGAQKRKNQKDIVTAAAMDEYEKGNADTDVDAILASLSDTHTEIEDRKASSSHLIFVRFINGSDPSKWGQYDSAETVEDFEETILESAGEVNEMLFGYAITVHKSQGSEWRKVYIILHQSHAQMCSRELLYTAITRAREELYIICEPDRGMKAGTLTKAAKMPRIKGNTLAEKLAFLKEKFDKDAAEAASAKAKKAAEEEDDE